MTEAKRPYVGGQAVLEGVMMRSPASYAVVVRRMDGSLSLRESRMVRVPSLWTRTPLLRGVATLVESLQLGSTALRFSADLLERDMEAAEADGSPPPPARKAGPLNVLLAFGLALAHLATRADTEPTQGSSASEQGGRAPNMMAIVTVVAVLFLLALPQFLAFVTSTLLHWNLETGGAANQALTGFFKLAVVLGYLISIRSVKEIRRVFQYHGAEHKTIATYEAEETLTVDNARSKTTLHPRCGTTFLVLTVLVSIVVWTALGPFLPRFGGSVLVQNAVFFLMKLPFLPVLVGITFELQRLTARYCLTGPLRVLLWPGFLVQRITTIEPDDTQLEVALASLRLTLWRDKVGEASEAVVATDASPETYASFDALMAAKPV